MIVYQYNSAGLYQCKSTADESPLEPGRFLIPAGCTSTPPPNNVPEGKHPRWNGTQWDLVNAPTMVPEPTPVEKLQQFLHDNPDVAALINP